MCNLVVLVETNDEGQFADFYFTVTFGNNDESIIQLLPGLVFKDSIGRNQEKSYKIYISPSEEEGEDPARSRDVVMSLMAYSGNPAIQLENPDIQKHVVSNKHN